MQEEKCIVLSKSLRNHNMYNSSYIVFETEMLLHVFKLTDSFMI